MVRESRFLDKSRQNMSLRKATCFLSLRQFLELLSVIFSLEQKQVSAGFRA